MVYKRNSNLSSTLATLDLGEYAYNLLGEPDWYTRFVDSASSEVVESLIPCRNLNMALNTKIINECLKQNTELALSVGFNELGSNHIMFFAGAAHFNIKSDGLLNKTPDELKALVLSQTSQNIVLTSTMVEHGDTINCNGKNIDPGDFFVEISKSFGFPIATYYSRPEHRGFSYNAPDSPRAVLWQDLFDKVKLYSTEFKDIKPLDYLIGKLAEHDLQYFSKESRSLPPVNAMYEKMMNAYRWGNLIRYDLNNYVPELASQGKSIHLIFYEGVPYVVDLNEK